MRLKPSVSQDEAYKYLSQNANLVWGDEAAAAMDTHLQAIAKSMATLSALDIPDEIEPLFGEDIGAAK